LLVYIITFSYFEWHGPIGSYIGRGFHRKRYNKISTNWNIKIINKTEIVRRWSCQSSRIDNGKCRIGINNRTKINWTNSRWKTNGNIDTSWKIKLVFESNISRYWWEYIKSCRTDC
jgi:hypothetical protein